MRKILYFASALLTTGMVMTSCAKYDNPVDVPETYTIVDENGNKYETDLVATFQGEVGAEVSLTLGVYDAYDIYGVDFGDGIIVVDTVCFENGGLKDENGLTREDTNHKSATKFTGTVAGDGNIKVYGKSDIWYLLASGGVMPTSFDQPKLLNVAQMSITGANAESVVLPEMPSLKQFSFNNSAVKTVDVSKATALTSLTINCTTASKYEPQLQSIDVSKNVELEYLSLQGNNKASGKLTSIDLSNNTKINSIYVQYNKIKDIKLPAGAELSFINVQDNELEAIDLSQLKSFKDAYLQGNKLKTVDVSNIKEGATLYVNDNELTELTVPVSLKNFQAQNNQLTKISLVNTTASCKLENNRLTIATLPTKPEGLNTASKIKKFTYSPQADMEITPEGAVVDLSAQASAQGILENAVATKFEFAAGETVLKAGEDYKETSVGKFEFLKSFEGVVCTMTTEAFPNLTLKTKAFDVKAGAAEIPNLWKATAEAPAAGATIIDNDFATVKTVYGTTATAATQTICNVAFDAYINVRADKAISADNLNGTEKSGSTPLVVTAKKNTTIKTYYRRQKGDGFVAGDGKDLKCIDQATPEEKSALSGTITFDETLTDVAADYGFVMKSYQLEAGHTYTIYGRGTTINFYGIAFE